MAMLRGFDVSHYQGSVDWASLKSRYGITWGAAKATEGVTFRDSQFAANWSKLKGAGLVRMAYHYAHPGGDPSASATQFLAFVKVAGGIEADDIMVMDMESNPNGLSMLQVRDWLAGWADIVTNETGRKPFLYCGSGYISDNVTLDIKPHYAAWWFPRYPAAYNGNTAWPTGISGYPSANNWGAAPDIWQFTATFGGPSMDANVANMTLADLKTRGSTAAPSPTPPPAPVPTPTPNPTPTGDIIDMATQAEVAQAVEDGLSNYMSRLFSDSGTGAEIWSEDRANAAALLAAVAGDTTVDQAVLAAVQDLGAKMDANTAAITALVAALTPKAP